MSKQADTLANRDDRDGLVRFLAIRMANRSAGETAGDWQLDDTEGWDCLNIDEQEEWLAEVRAVLADLEGQRPLPSTQQPTDAALGDARTRAVAVLGFHDGAFDGGFFGARGRVAALIERNDAEVASLRYHAESIGAEVRELRALLKSLEWSGGDPCGMPVCPDCGADAPRDDGREYMHEPDCDLSRALAASLHGEGT